MIIGRFAPSPTGKIHLGNLRIALINYLWIKKQGGLFFLRIDDTDKLRSKQEYIENIEESLLWCGIRWDKQFNQNNNTSRYEEVFQNLLEDGVIYPCYESEEELELQRKHLLSLKRPPIYNRQALNLTEDLKIQLSEKGIKPHFRFKLARKIIEWDDAIHGKIKINTSTLSDPIIRRTNGEYTYMLPSVIDDFDNSISHIIRGEDHLTNTAIQIEMFERMINMAKHEKDPQIPKFAHISLLKFENQKISKRLGGLEIESFMNSNVFPLAVTSYLAKLGTSTQDAKIFKNIDEMINDFDISKFTTSSTIIDIKNIDILNKKIIQTSLFEDIKDKLHNKEINQLFWDAIKNNISSIKEADILYDKYHSISSYKDSSIKQDFLQRMLYEIDNIPETITQSSIKNLIDKLIKYFPQYKPRDIYLWVRLILTGESTGPELYKLFQIISTETIKKKIQHIMT